MTKMMVMWRGQVPSRVKVAAASCLLQNAHVQAGRLIDKYGQADQRPPQTGRSELAQGMAGKLAQLGQALLLHSFVNALAGLGQGGMGLAV